VLVSVTGEPKQPKPKQPLPKQSRSKQSKLGTAARSDRKGEWRRSTETRKIVLDAARELFNVHGYDGTSIHDIVARSGVSVGSIYHQFGGKSEVFRALVETSWERHTHVSDEARRQAIDEGESDPLRIYVAGARAFLMDTWRDRNVDRVSILLEGPPAFAALSRQHRAKFIQGSMGLTLGDPPLPDSSAFALTALLHAAATQLMGVDDQRVAEAVVDYFTGLVLKLGPAEGEGSLPGSG
jgi:AcrR family transcriptional regulator